MYNLPISAEDILALKAVVYGANTNKKLVLGTYTVFNIDGSIREKIPFDEAIERVIELIVNAEEEKE